MALAINQKHTMKEETHCLNLCNKAIVATLVKPKAIQ